VVLPALPAAAVEVPAAAARAAELHRRPAARAAPSRADAPSAPAAAVDERAVNDTATASAQAGAQAPSGASSPPSADTAAAAAAPAIEVPVYATRLPPAGRWLYRMQRGVAIGVAELSWEPQADAQYELHLQGRVAGLTLLDWVSQGRLDGAGIAPGRFAVRRRGRDVQAANFQREAGKITFSGPKTEWPLLAGAQDRLSWLLQLSAIVAAAPERFTPGMNVVLFVAGARGDADVWTFVVQGQELLDGLPALRLLREPTRLYGVRAEVWLDPQSHYLPLRVLQTPSGGGAALELMLEPR